MINVCIGEKPHLHFALVDSLEQLSQFGIWLEDIIQGQGIVDFAIKREGINLVVTCESLNGETVFFVVLLLEHVGVFMVEGEVFCEEDVCTDEKSISYGAFSGSLENFEQVLTDQFLHLLMDVACYAQ